MAFLVLYDPCKVRMVKCTASGPNQCSRDFAREKTIYTEIKRVLNCLVIQLPQHGSSDVV